jgi:hypothetical protein
MTNTLSSLVVLLATLGTCAANDDPVPGRGGNYEFAPETVEGTTWEGGLDHGAFILRFEGSGVLRCSWWSANLRNCTWRQKGNVIYLELGSRLGEYRCEIHGDQLIGEASNKVGAHWKWDVKLRGPTRKPPIGDW